MDGIGTVTTGYDRKDAVRGTVKRFDDSKGYGFILTDAPPLAGQEIFVHFTNIISKEKHRTLQQNQEVEFIPQYGDKGWYALGVMVVAP